MSVEDIHNTQPTFELSHAEIFESFNPEDIFELKTYQEEILKLNGVRCLSLGPVSLKFMTTYPETSAQLTTNEDMYDGMATPGGIPLEDIIDEDEVTIALSTARNGLRVVSAAGFGKSSYVDTLGKQIEDEHEEYSRAIRARRSVIAFLALSTIETSNEEDRLHGAS